MAFKRSFTATISPAANATDQKFALSYNDQYRTIHVKAIYSDVQAVRFQLGCIVNGFEYARFATKLFDDGNGPQPVEFDVPINATFQLVTNEGSSTAHANTQVTIFYEVDQDK